MTRRTIVLILGSWIAWHTFANGQAWATSLFRCITEDEQIVYTDTPTQLQQCAPIPTSGSVTSLATTSSGAPGPGLAPDSPPPTPALLQPQAAPAPEGSSTTFLDSPASPASNPLPCPVGINPLNPFTAPPCPAPETAQPTDPLISSPNTPPTVP